MSKSIKQFSVISFTVNETNGDWESILDVMSAGELPQSEYVRLRGAGTMSIRNEFSVGSAEAMIVLTSACAVLSAATHMPIAVSRRWVTNAIADNDSISVEFEVSSDGSVRVTVDGAILNWHLTSDYDGHQLSLSETFDHLDNVPALMCIDDAVYKRSRV